MALTIKLDLNLEQANLLKEAVDHLGNLYEFNVKAVEATDEERMLAGQKLLQCEQLQRLLK